MGFAERDGQKFELLRWSEAIAIRYAMDNRDHAAEMLAAGKPPMDEARRGVVALGMVLHERVIDLTATFFDLRGQWTPPTNKDQLALARRMLPLMYDETRT